MRTEIEAAPAVPPLALNTREAAEALRISQRKLWGMTKRGEIPHVRLNGRIVYPVREIERWLGERATGGPHP